ncbi:unnamed protein product [Vicia faba]|uniref:Uncharacterized protein n=1 Tax=Vicia faba TaxID=3906 RepID=A0AAV0ZFV8_VICFA|nr:unnamed protein product [Vicia faba]
MMSISELISELRDSFRQRDFDRVEETLIFRETKLKAEIEDKKREIALLSEEVHFQRLEKMSVEMELKRFKELQDGGNIARAVAESGNARVSAAPETLVVREAALKSAIEEKVGEIKQDQFINLGKLNFDIEVHVVRGEKRGEEPLHDGKKDGPEDAFGTGNDFGSVKETLDVREATNTAAIEDKMKEIRLLREKMVNREKYATAEVKDEKIDVLAEETKLASEPSKTAYLGSSGNWGQNSSRVVPKNFTTKVAEPAGVIKRDFTSSVDVANFLDGLDTGSSSSSSSSSSSGEFDISSFTPVKRTKLSQGK